MLAWRKSPHKEDGRKPDGRFAASEVVSDVAYGQRKRVNASGDSKGEENDVILMDIGASEHVVMNFTMFDTMEEISPVEMRLSNAYSVRAWYRGHTTVKI